MSIKSKKTLLTACAAAALALVAPSARASFTATPASAIVTAGASKNVALAITFTQTYIGSGGQACPVVISGLPAGVSASSSYTPVTGSAVASTNVNFNVSPGAASGTYTIGFAGSAAGGCPSDFPVDPGVGAMSLTIVPVGVFFNTVSVQQGQTVTTNFSTHYTPTSFGPAGQSCPITVTGLPAGMSFIPSPLTYQPVFGESYTTSTVQIATTAATPVGSYTLTYSANSCVGAYQFIGDGRESTSSVRASLTGAYLLDAGGGSSIVNVTAPPSVSITPNPANVAVTQGNTSVPINVALDFGSPASASGTCQLALSGFPAGASHLPSPVAYAVTSGSGTSSTSFQIVTSASTPPGAYTISLSGDPTPCPASSPVSTGSGSVTLTVNAAGPVPSFNASVSPDPLTLLPGGPAQNVAVTTTPLNGFANGITFSFTGLPQGIDPGPSQRVTSPYPIANFSFSASASVTPGTYAGVLNGLEDGQSVPKTFPVTVNVQAQPSFSFSVSPVPVSLVAGGLAQALTILTTANNGFNQPILYTLIGTPQGVTYSPSSQTASSPYAPTSFSLLATGAAAAGNYTATVQATLPGGERQTQTFEIAVSPSTFADIDVSFGLPTMALCNVSTPSRNTIKLTPIGAYSGTPLVAFQNVSSSILTITPLNPVAGAMPPGQSLDFTVAANTLTPPASTVVTVLVTDVERGIRKTANLIVNFLRGDFTAAASPTSLNIEAGGAGQALALSVFRNQCLIENGVAVQVSAQTSYPEVTITPSSTSLTDTTAFLVQATPRARPGLVSITFLLTAAGVTRSVDVNVNVTAAPPGPSYAATLTPNPLVIVAGGSASVEVATIADFGLLSPLTYGFTGLPPGVTSDGPKVTAFPYPKLTFTFQAAADTVVGTYAVTLRGSFANGTNVKTFSLLLNVRKPVGDFEVTFEKPAITLCNNGVEQLGSILLTPLGGYTGTPTLAFGKIPTGITVTPVNPTTPALPPARTVAFAVSANGAAVGPTTVELTVADPAYGISKTLLLALDVVQPSFATTFDPPAVTLETGGAGQTISIAARGANDCFVATRFTISPVDLPAGIEVTPSSITVNAPGFGPAVFTLKATSAARPGTYPISFNFVPGVGPARVVQALATVVYPSCEAPNPPASAKIAPDGNPLGPVTSTDFLALSWTPPTAGTTPSRYEYRVNGGPQMSTTSLSAVAPPRGTNEPVQLFVRSFACDPEQGPSAETASPVYTMASPQADFSAPDTARVGVAITLTDTSKPQATSWLWLYDDGSPAGTTQAQTHTFTSAGTHTVALIASNGSGSSLKTKTINVSTSAGAPPTTSLRFRPFDARDPERRRLRANLRTGLASQLVLSTNDITKVIVFLRLLDDDGSVRLERRLVLDPGFEATYDLTAFGDGEFTVELVSGQPFAATLIEDEPDAPTRDGPDFKEVK